ncbi:mucin-6-like [Petromyzon marinus]|uniref:mucin-6-like n=1 Tax=Petromyzon marinus TaxID=7757 RepID=UPI003F6E774E
MGYGMTWGQTHYRTFDGKIYRFRGLGSYLLVGDMQDHTFHIYVNNDINPECGLSGAPACERSLTVLMEEVRIELRRDSDGPAAFAQGERLQLPVITYGVVIEQSASYILLKSGLGFTLRWDGADSVFVQISETMLGMTYGLLGTFDRDCSNDFTSITGQLTSVAITFAATFRVNGSSPVPGHAPLPLPAPIGHLQADFCDFQHTLSGFNPTSLSALLACKDLLNTACKDVVDPIPFYDACAEDICRAGGDASFVCDSMAAYFRECSRHGISVEWRSDQRCPRTHNGTPGISHRTSLRPPYCARSTHAAIQCPCGMVYNSCGSSCPKTCFDATYDCEDDLCIDGCHCPEGTYLHNGTCLKREECPCLYIRREFTPGTRIQQDCNTCICQYGKWTCSQNQCDATCAVIGEVSYTTFDGRTYEFEGECQYTLVRGVSSCSTSLSYQIDVQLTKDCNQGGFSRAVILTVSGESARLGEAGQLLVSNSEERLPYAGQGFQVERVSQEFVKLTLLNGLTLLFDGRNRVYVTAHPALMGSMEGLCGNFDNHQLNDFRTPLGDVESAPGAFANKWKALATCASAAVEVVDPCEINQYRRLRAQSVCGLLLQAPFSRESRPRVCVSVRDCYSLTELAPILLILYGGSLSLCVCVMRAECHEVVSHHTYYDSCMNTLCSTDLTWPECDSLADYSLACARAGVTIAGWRDAVPECGTRQPLSSSSPFQPKAAAREVDRSSRDGSHPSRPPHPVPLSAATPHTSPHRPPRRAVALCPLGMQYLECGSACDASCGSLALELSARVDCTEQCVQGCSCPLGSVLDYEGRCVPPEDCPCVWEGIYYVSGEARMQDCNIWCARSRKHGRRGMPGHRMLLPPLMSPTSRCPSRFAVTATPNECYRGKWLCTTNDCGTKDLCGPHQEYVSCKDPEPLTCDNMHLPRTRNAPQPSAGRCAGGCQCDNTTVWDAARGACVLPQECPCYHGGMSYGDGESMKVECNLCVCINQQWQCETKLCSGLCTAYGSSHIKSFDGKLYQFQGSCEYVYAQSTVDGPLGSFAVSAENVPCGTSGTTCTKAVTLAVTRAGVTHRLRLVRGEPVAADSALLFHVSYVGRWVFVRTDMGVTLSWDRGTHLQIKLDQGFSKGLVSWGWYRANVLLANVLHLPRKTLLRFRPLLIVIFFSLSLSFTNLETFVQVMGLCGDYDGNQLNDFTTPQGIVVIQEDAFADSWKVRSYCLDAKLVTDTCALFPQREAWAKRKCGIIRSEAFAACHAEVPYYVYFERCVYDACGCDSGADCECLCTAVAAYAQECNRYGVYVYWRTPEFCPGHRTLKPTTRTASVALRQPRKPTDGPTAPRRVPLRPTAMQCDGCMRYDPCVPACPKTCENYERYEEVYASCPDVCVEGCRCVHDNEVFNELTTKCMRLEECVCKVIDGVLIYDGQKIDSLSDECRSW